jgi:hypothetical protein
LSISDRASRSRGSRRYVWWKRRIHERNIEFAVWRNVVCICGSWKMEWRR